MGHNGPHWQALQSTGERPGERELFGPRASETEFYLSPSPGVLRP